MLGRVHGRGMDNQPLPMPLAEPKQFLTYLDNGQDTPGTSTNNLAIRGSIESGPIEH
jgi:hypothetical protein